MPSSNVSYWNNKIKKNKIRDKVVSKMLKRKAWRVLRIWEHEIKSENINNKLSRIKKIEQGKQGKTKNGKNIFENLDNVITVNNRLRREFK
jgi:DNA mismatch endonuclease (patch repair protein)